MYMYMYTVQKMWIRYVHVYSTKDIYVIIIDKWYTLYMYTVQKTYNIDKICICTCDGNKKVVYATILISDVYVHVHVYVHVYIHVSSLYNVGFHSLLITLL